MQDVVPHGCSRWPRNRAAHGAPQRPTPIIALTHFRCCLCKGHDNSALQRLQPPSTAIKRVEAGRTPPSESDRDGK
eukprot:13604280-Alexandrium_andersonii.AAC.1